MRRGSIGICVAPADGTDLAFDAYIAFEPLETNVRMRDPGLVARLERHFADFHGALKAGDSTLPALVMWVGFTIALGWVGSKVRQRYGRGDAAEPGKRNRTVAAVVDGLADGRAAVVLKVHHFLPANSYAQQLFIQRPVLRPFERGRGFYCYGRAARGPRETQGLVLARFGCDAHTLLGYRRGGRGVGLGEEGHPGLADAAAHHHVVGVAAGEEHRRAGEAGGQRLGHLARPRHGGESRTGQAAERRRLVGIRRGRHHHELVQCRRRRDRIAVDARPALHRHHEGRRELQCGEGSVDRGLERRGTAATRRSQAVMALQAGFRLAASGTPIENHLGELWNLFLTGAPGVIMSHPLINIAADMTCGGRNFVGWACDDATEALREAFLAADDAGRPAALERYHRRLMEMQPYVLLGQYDAVSAIRSNVSGFLDSPVLVYWNVEVRK